MSRSPETPLILWICAAVCAHFMFGGGTEEVSTKMRELRDGERFVTELGASARERAAAGSQPLEIAIIDEGATPEEDRPEPEEQKKPDEQKKAEEQKKPDEQKKAEEQKKPDEPAPEVKVAVEEEDPLKKLDQEPLKTDQRIAVRQHVKPNQADNPTARHIGDEANTVQDETVATQTSTDEDDPNPTPGANKTAGPQDAVGDSERTKIAESDEHPGNKDTAPGERATEFDLEHDNRPIERPQATAAISAPPAEAVPRAGGDGRAPAKIAEQVPPQLAPGAAPEQQPEVVQSDRGASWFNPIQPGARDPQNIAGTTNQNNPLTPSAPGNTRWLGLGGKVGPGQVNINLTQVGVVAVVGADQLRKEREADGERRKSEHRGSWTASNFERWRNAIENYVSSVKPGNQTALNTAAVPFATYLNTIHNRIHPLFADSFLGSLDNLPKTHPLNSPRLITRLEIVVSPKEGRVVKMGIVKTSGITAFDVAALDSVHRAQPFGPAPGAIISTDGNVYLHWEFHRDEVFACSTMHARPFLLNTPASGPEEAPQPPAPSPKSPSQERGAPPPVNLREMREGRAPRPAKSATTG